MESEKYIFISDLHLGDENSFKPKDPARFPYGWTNRHVAELHAFLAGLEDHPETQGAARVMIVGDLVDTWVCPSMCNPPSFDAVLRADHNKPVIAALNTLAQAGRLMYIPGNHDMLIEAQTLLNHIPGLEIAGDTTGHVTFYDDMLVAEHGHQYCLFNAVDTWSRPGGRLPLGIFMAQLVAEGAYEKNDPTHYLEILVELIEKFSPETALATQVLDAIRNYEKDDVKAVHPDPFLMNHMDQFGPQISYADVIRIYGGIFDQWDKKSGSKVRATLAVMGDGGLLRPAADFIYLGRDLAKIVIFGHTHTYEIEKGLVGGAEPENEVGDAARAVVIYGNCGTWIDAKRCTFIVTDKFAVAGENRIYVRGYEYSLKQDSNVGRVSEPLDEAYVVV